MNSTPPPLPSERILIVDDDPVVIKAISMKLKSKGYEVFTGIDGSEAVKAAREHKPNLIILDITFPPDVGQPWDGFKVMEWLRRMDENSSVPIIVISGGEPAQYKARALAGGAVAYFQKPVDSDELFNTIRQALSNPASAKKPAAAGDPQV